MTVTLAEPALTLTAAASARVQALRIEAGDPALKLRISVDGGGCSGFRYDFSMAPRAAAEDLVLAREGVELLVDRLSLPYLEGARVDYVEALAGAQFVVHNPKAKATCGCGSSFTL